MNNMWGLKNCDTCRKARRWLEIHRIVFSFHDVREDTPDSSRLSHWLKTAGVEVLVNRRGTTWRNLAESAKHKLEAGDVVAVLEKHPTLLKRPILEHGKNVLVGFNVASYDELVGESR
ncbi:MAG: Spx/MgsR family RNA polymerase-binding regulatory protein [Gammaproteobacteria bacterium]